MSKCIMPFIHLGTKPDGIARVCCMAPSLEITNGNTPYNLLDGNLQEVWNSEYMKDIRLKVASGEKLPACNSCFTEESRGKKSKRQTENEKWKSQEWRFNYALTNNGSMPDNPMYFDLRMGNLCNLRCHTCNPLFSSEWANELNTSDTWKNNPLIANFFTHTLSRANNMRSWSSPNFWDEFSAVLPGIREIYISGGEPTIIRPLWDFLHGCVERNLAPNIKIRMNSNLSVLPSGFSKFINEFKRFQIGISVDGIGLKNDWIRPPSKFAKVEENILKLKETRAVVEINTTLSVFNALYVDEVYNWAKGLGLHTTLDILHDPKYHRPCLLPKHLHSQAINRFQTIRPNDSFLQNQLNETPDPSWLLALRTHIKNWDNGSFIQVFPELKELLND